MMSIVGFVSSGKRRELIKDGMLEISNKEDMYVDLDIEAGNIEIDGFNVKIKKPEMSEEEFIRITEENKDKYISMMIGKNESTQNITRGLTFYSKLDDGYSFDFYWYIKDKTYIGDDGVILCAEPFDTEVEMYVCYQSYSIDYSIPIHVEPCREEVARIEENNIKQELLDAINNNSDAMIYENDSVKIQLPVNVNGKKARYYKSKIEKKYSYLLFAPISVFAVLLGFKNDEKRRQREKINVIMSEYPVLLQKVSLYVSSGMTIRNIWCKVCEDVQRKKMDKHPLYQEMITTLNEMNNGVSEGMAYMRFGERIGRSEIIRFTALLAQNIKTGSTKLSELLDNEAHNAFVDKKNRAKKQGEEMGTKLMFPMILLLTDTLVLIMIPAFWSL